MSRRKSGSGVGYGHRKMVVESLERRSMLAGNVIVSVEGGSLIVRGDNTDNAVLIQDEGGGNYTVTGLDFADSPELSDRGFKSGPTTIKGGEDLGGGTHLFTGVTNDINIDLKKGNDVLGIGNSVEDLDELARECFGFGFGTGSGSGGGGGSGGTSESPNSIVAEQVAEGQFVVPRNLIVNTGDGNDYMAISASVGSPTLGGVAVINTGNGDDGVAFGNPFSAAPGLSEEGAELNEVFDGNAHVEDDLIILTGKGNDNVCVSHVTADDLLTVQTGDGNDELHAEEFAAGHAVMTSGNGNDFMTLVFFALDRELVVDSGAGNDDVIVADFSMGHGEGPASQSGAGYATIVTGAGNDAVVVSDFECDGMVVNTGAGNDGVSFDDSAPSRIKAQQFLTGPVFVGFGDITNQLTVATGAGNDFVEVEFISAHDIVVDTGAGNDGSSQLPIIIYNVQVAGNLTVVTGAGNDFLYMYSGVEGDQSSTGNNLVVNMGAGNDAAQITDQSIGNDLTVVLGAGTNSAAIGVSAQFGGDSEGILEVGHNLTVVGGSGKDTITAGNLDVHNDLFAILGAGNDSLFLSGATVGNNALVDAGAGNDSVTIQDTQVAGTATALMSAGNDTLSVFGSSAKKSVARGGAGKDTFNNDFGVTENGKTDTTDVEEFESFNIEVELD